MARIRKLTRAEAGPAAGPFFDWIIQNNGKVLNSTGVWAHCPPVALAFKGMTTSFAESNQVTEELRRLVNLRSAQMTGCPS